MRVILATIATSLLKQAFGPNILKKVFTISKGVFHCIEVHVENLKVVARMTEVSPRDPFLVVVCRHPGNVLKPNGPGMPHYGRLS